MVKVKQVNVTANYAWSPVELYPVQLATATAAQQLDATFSTSASLSLYNVDLSDPSKDLKLAGMVTTPERFYKVIWGYAGLDSAECNRGLVVCGADNGVINIYDPKKLVDNTESEAALVNSSNKHTGPVRALDFNPFQKNLYASGASESEIFIWDLKNPSNPMTPGTKTEPSAAISSVAWNRQVQHILGSSTCVTSGPSCLVWDLRKNESIIKVQDPSGRMQCSEIAWHPEVATQLVLASEDDRSPVVQLWDLRFATSPLKVLEDHHRGVVSVAWCQQDPDLLMTCGKDNRVLCWNPNSTPPEILYEVPSAAQWCFDVQWCPRNPAMVSMGSFDGHISIHSLMGGTTYTEVPTKQQQDALAESFGGSAFAAAPLPQQPQTPKKVVSMPLKKPPKWICRPCGATFSFGGKLVSFASTKQTGEQQSQEGVRRTVQISQVVTETEFIARSEELQNALSTNQFDEYCQKKLEASNTEFEEDLWSFLKAKFESEPRKQYLHLLGYDANTVRMKINAIVDTGEEDKLSPKMEELSTSVDSSDTSQSVEGAEAFEMIAANRSNESVRSQMESPSKPLVIPSGDKDPDSLISQALLVGDYESAVSMCLQENRMADAIILAIAGGSQLLERTQKAYFSRCTSKIGQLMFAVATRNWAEIVRSCELTNWKEALATLLTYSSKEEMNTLCDELGVRLESNPEQKIHACLCYICSGNVERLVQCWNSISSHSDADGSSPGALQDLIEKVMVLRKAVEGVAGMGVGQAAAEKLANYASILASQGKLEAAINYLPDSIENAEIRLLRERLAFALGTSSSTPNHQRQQYMGTNQGQPSPGYERNAYVGQTQPISNLGSPAMQPIQPHAPSFSTSRPEAVTNNPYASKRRTQQKPGYAAPSPMNMYVPQHPAAPTVPQGPMNGYSPGNMQEPKPTGPHPSHPTLGAPSNSAPMVPQPVRSPNQPAYGAPEPRAMPPGESTEKPGWNDPPAFDPNRVPRKKKPTVQPFTPQNFNLMTPVEPARAPAPMAPGSNMMMQPGMNPIHAPQYITQPNGPPGAPIGAQQPPAPAPSVPTAAPKDVPKAPIPPEHQILQTHFEGLIKRCVGQTTNAQTKRKLDDCVRRMEFLYDKLRANTLSPQIVTGLHQVAQFISARDYASGLRQHTLIVSSSNFSEISAFMPGLKSVLQIASQLRV